MRVMLYTTCSVWFGKRGTQFSERRGLRLINIVLIRIKCKAECKCIQKNEKEEWCLLKPE